MRHRALAATTLLAILGAVALFAPPALAQQILFSTENDFLTDNPTRDDLYSFAAALELRWRQLDLSLREDGFTDRAAGRRHDETFLSIGRDLPLPGPWRVAVEVGLVHVGHGLLGESAQNALHRAIGSDEVELAYRGSSFHGRAALEAGRDFALGERLELGPRLELDLVPGLRSHALIAAQASWRPSERLALELAAGVRFAHASFDALEQHLENRAPAARLGVLLDQRWFVSWSYNEHGDRREHLSVGYRFGPGGRADGGATE